ncbi:MAG: TetR/AcrR family transcriptional regulator [Ignavibacteria bacterium]
MRKKEGNKEEKIFYAALKSFAIHGFYRSRIEEIAQNAGVSIGSIYVYYNDKKDILYRIFDRTWTELYKNLLFIYDRTDLKASDKVDLMIDLIFDTFSKNPDLAIIITNEQRKLYADPSKKFTPYYDKFLELAKKIIQQGIKEGTFYENIHWEVMRHFVIGSFRELLSTWVSHKSNLSLNDMKESVRFLIKYGISKYPSGEQLISETSPTDESQN